MKKRNLTSWILMLALALLVVLVSTMATAAGVVKPEMPDGATLLRSALEQARRAGAYRVTLDVQQTVLSAGAIGEQSARFRIEGDIAGPQQARLTIRDGQVRGAFSSTSLLTSSADQEILISEGAIYQREGDAWVKQPEAVVAPGLNADSLALLEVARDITLLDPVDTLAGTFERAAFTLESRDVLRFMLRQSGYDDPEIEARLALSGMEYGGTGELWVDAAGFPARLTLSLALARGGRDGYRANAVSTALFSDFGQALPPARFNPAVTPISQGASQAYSWDLGVNEQVASSGLLAATLATFLALAFLLYRTRSVRHAYAVVSAVLVMSLLSPLVAQAASGSQRAYPARPSSTGSAASASAVENLALNARELGNRQREHIAAQASTLDPLEDTDGDTLPNGYELTLGTNPFAADSDFDGLSDAQEVLGMICLNGNTTITVETDPLNPDSNADGIRDGDEFDRGVCRFTESGDRPFAWDDDNDSDGVFDDLDLSPFTASQVFRADGANLSFETLASLSGTPPREVYYFEVQLRPEEARSLQFAYKSALEWPLDDKGLIQHDPNSGTTGMLQIAPFLEVTLDDDDLPSGNAMQQYGLGATPVLDGNGAPTGESTLIIPLAPVERGGKTHALQAKVLQDRISTDGVIRWRNARLKWGVQGDVLRPDDDGNMVSSPSGSYGLVVYDEPYRITGVQTSRQGGASSLVAGAIRDAGANPAAVTLLRGALETQFLGGRLTLADIYNRFNLGSTATITERWGITQTFTVSPPRDYLHLDQMILTTNVTTTRDLLNAAYPGGSIRPTLLVATEQRTATLNVDDLPNPNFSNLLMNACFTQMVTSRTLKLASYRWDPSAGVVATGVGSASTVGTSALGDWVMLGLDEVLADIQQQFDAIYGTLEDFYNETMAVLQMAMTAWYQGQTVIQAIGDLQLADISNVLDDAAFYTQILDLLDAAGLFNGLPQEFRPAVEFLLGVLNYPGGPAQWLEDQWNTVVAIGENLVGSFKDFSAGEFAFTPDSLISFTQTAINVLTWLASILDFGFLSDAVKVLTKLLDIFNKVQQLWSTIQALIEHGTAVVAEMVLALVSELSALSSGLQIIGVILNVFSTLLSMFFQLALGNLSVLGFIGAVLRAVVEIAITVVLFVVASIFPYGTLLALAIGIARGISAFLKDWFGDVGEVLAWVFDPIGAFLDAANPDPEPLATFLGNPRVGKLQFQTFPGYPLGGFIAGDRFGFAITGTVTMVGSNTALNRSRAWVQLGRYAAGESFELCGMQILQYLTDTGQLDQFSRYGSAVVKGQCATFSLDYERDWTYTRSNDRQRSSVYFATTIPGTSFPLPQPLRARDYDVTSQLNINPREPKINGVIALDMTLDVVQLWENCGIAGLDCDVYPEEYVAPPSVGYVYVDILPRSLVEFWDWEELRNNDPDGDGLIGNQDQGIIGFDNGLCGLTNTHLKSDSELAPDGLTDNFELFAYSSSPCSSDTDADGLNDREEFVLGTDPRKADTDGDGLRDGDEGARWFPNASGLSVPWRVDMRGAYPGLPNPAAFPNPRIANADRDPRSDKKEKELLSSPNAFDVSDIEVAITQELLQGGGTRLRLTTFPWNNDAAAGLAPQLTLTLPIAFNGVTVSARLLNKTFPGLNPISGTPVAGLPANVYAWTFPPLTLNRLVQVTFSGVPANIPVEDVFLDVAFSYTEGTVPRQTTANVPLLINRGGPLSTITAPPVGGITRWNTSALYGPVRIQGTADDPEGIGSVQVCVKASGACAAGDWKTALVGSLYSLGWTYDWTPPADGAYTALARATDAYGVAGPVSAPVAFFVDSTPLASARFDLDGTAYVSTTFSLSSLATFTVTGRIADAAGAYVSGAGGALVNATLLTPWQVTAQGTEYLRGESTLAAPGASSSAFDTRFSLPTTPFGGTASPYAEGEYQLQLSANDRAGNVSANADTLTVIVDDTPPFVTLRVPQTVLANSLDLGGRADDTALSLRRVAPSPYTTTQQLEDRDTEFAGVNPNGRAYLVGDVNGDTLDDVLLVTWEARKNLQAGLFFGRISGFPSNLSLAEADVALYGEADFGTSSAYPPAVAINTPGLLDVNGDGIADILLGDGNANSGAGRAYVVLGRRNWTSTIDLGNADWRLSVPQTTGFGASVASAGDLDGDGLVDVAIGAVAENAGVAGINNEVLFLYLGLERGAPSLQSRFYGRNCRGGCVTPRVPNLAGVGDANGDGLSDVLLAGFEMTWLIYGRPKHTLPVSGLAEANAIAVLDGGGVQHTVSAVGDVNGDGLRDLLVGDPLGGPTRVFVVFGRRPERGFPVPPASLDLVTAADISFVGLVDGVRYPFMGESLAPMGDLDRDGKDDFAFGRTGAEGGASIVLSGKLPWVREQSPALAAYRIDSTRSDYEVGRTLSSGDSNGDGIRDLLVGAPGALRALLFNGQSPRLTPSGISRVEIGIAGPITEPDKPFTATLPAVWIPATLANVNGAATTFRAALNFSASGDYRLYARALDRAGNRLPAEAWYIGTTFVNLNVEQLPALSVSLNAPVLIPEGFLRVNLSGGVNGASPIQHLRAFDGERWIRLPLLNAAPGAWTSESNIQRSDRRTIPFRVVARDALGNVAHAVQLVTTDTLVAAPALSANLPVTSWQTNTTPTLTITWSPVTDAGGAVTRYAIIDQNPETVPATLVTVNQVSRALNAPGAWYAHVRVVDAAGNQQVVHDGPFGVNRTRTPSAILPDGWLDFDGGEYPIGMTSSYDPYTAFKPALMLATWDANRLYLGFTGSDWNLQQRLVIYLDTRAGGRATSLGAALPGGEPVHSLPFAADFALALTGPQSFTLFSSNTAGWTPVATPLSFAVVGDGTEITFDRNEIRAVAGVPVALLAYVATEAEVAAVIPASARPATAELLPGAVTFGDAIRWSSLRNGFPASASDLPVQRIAPLVRVEPGTLTHLNPAETANLVVTVTNPDILSYRSHPLTVTLGGASPQLLEFVNLNGGAACVNCPPNGRVWVLSVNVPAEGTREVNFTVRARNPGASGVFAAGVEARLAHQGLPLAPQPPATATYTVDNSVAQVQVGLLGTTIYAQPGFFKLPVLPKLGNSVLACRQQVSLNRGAGWEALGSLGALSSITTMLPAGYNSVWQLRVSGPGGQTATTSVTVATDTSAPSVQVVPTPILSRGFSWLGGTANDNSGRLKAVEVSLNGNPFRRALLLGDGSVRLNEVQAASLAWALPLDVAGADGDTLQVVARAVDAAGNVGPQSAPVTVILDAVGPHLVITESLDRAAGTVSDGSGVLQVWVSLDGGVTYQDAVLVNGAWSFDYTAWQGGTPIGVVIVRAEDIHGNVSQAAALLNATPTQFHIYLPLVLQNAR